MAIRGRAYLAAGSLDRERRFVCSSPWVGKFSLRQPGSGGSVTHRCSGRDWGLCVGQRRNHSQSAGKFTGAILAISACAGSVADDHGDAGVCGGASRESWVSTLETDRLVSWLGRITFRGELKWREWLFAIARIESPAFTPSGWRRGCDESCRLKSIPNMGATANTKFLSTATL